MTEQQTTPTRQVSSAAQNALMVATMAGAPLRGLMGGGSHTGELVPNRAGIKVPVGNAYQSLSNWNGTKFTRGWLDGSGGADIEQNLGACAMIVKPAPFNSRTSANWRAAGPRAPVPGLSNLDVESPARTWGPLSQARAEFIPTTWSDQLAGLDIVSGHVGARVFAAQSKIDASPTPTYYAYAQVRDGGDGFPSYPNASDQRPTKKKAVSDRLRASAAGFPPT